MFSNGKGGWGSRFIYRSKKPRGAARNADGTRAMPFTSPHNSFGCAPIYPPRYRRPAPNAPVLLRAKAHENHASVIRNDAASSLRLATLRARTIGVLCL